MSVTILNSGGQTVTVQAVTLANGTQAMQSVPTNPLGSAMIGSATSANSLPVVIASDQAPIPVSGNFTATFGGTTNVNIVQVGGAALAFGQATSAGSIPMVIASDQSAIPTTFSGALANGTNAIGTVTAIQLGTWAINMTQVGGQSMGLGQTNASGSLPVVIANNQSVIPVSGSFTAVIGTTAVNIVQVSGATVALGSTLMASSFPIVLATDQPNIKVQLQTGSTPIGTVSAIQIGTWAINMTQVGGNAVALGQTTMASSIPVTFASNQSALTISGTITATLGSATPNNFVTVSAASGAVTAVNVKTTSGTLFGMTLYNNNTATPVFMKLYNLTAAAVNSSVLPIMRLGISPGFPFEMTRSNGVAFTTALSYTITGLVATNDTTTVNTDDIVGWVNYN